MIAFHGVSCKRKTIGGIRTGDIPPGYQRRSAAGQDTGPQWTRSMT